MAVPLVPGPGLGDANAAQKSMSTLLKNQCDFCAVLIEPKHGYAAFALSALAPRASCPCFSPPLVRFPPLPLASLAGKRRLLVRTARHERRDECVLSSCFEVVGVARAEPDANTGPGLVVGTPRAAVADTKRGLGARCPRICGALSPGCLLPSGPPQDPARAVGLPCGSSVPQNLRGTFAGGLPS